MSQKNDDKRDIVMQQMSDSLHTFICHTIRTQFTKYIITPSQSDKDNEDENEPENVNRNGILCFDEGIKKLSEIFEKKTKLIQI